MSKKQTIQDLRHHIEGLERQNEALRTDMRRDAERQTLLGRALDDARVENARLRAAHPRGVRVVTGDDTFTFPAATGWSLGDGGVAIMAGDERLAHVLADDIRVVTFLDEKGA